MSQKIIKKPGVSSVFDEPRCPRATRVSSGGPIEGKQERESPAFRAGKGQEFPTCEPRKGHCGSVGAKGQWGSPHEIEVSLLFRTLLFRELGVFIMSGSRHSGEKSS